MQVYKPFRLRGPLDAVHRMHQLSLSLFLSRFVPLAFVPSPPLSYLLCLMPPNPDPHSPLRSLPRDPFARFINLALLSPLVPPSFARRWTAAVLQFQPHFCASLSRQANTIKRATLSGTDAYRCALFFQATQAFSQESTCATYPRFAKNIKPVSQRDLFARFDRIVNRLQAFSRLSKSSFEISYEASLRRTAACFIGFDFQSRQIDRGFHHYVDIPSERRFAREGFCIALILSIGLNIFEARKCYVDQYH